MWSYDIILCDSNLNMRLWCCNYQVSRFAQNIILSFDIIFWKIMLQNKLASRWFSQPRSIAKNKEISHWRSKENRCAELRNSRAWKTKFKGLKWDRRLAFLVWYNGGLPSFIPTTPTPLGYKNEKNWQLEGTQDSAQAKNKN